MTEDEFWRLQFHDSRRSAMTVICRSPWGGPVTTCEVHRSAWPSGAARCDEAYRHLNIRPIGSQP